MSLKQSNLGFPFERWSGRAGRTMTRNGIHAVRVLARRGDEVRRLCAFSFSKGDASLYLFPAANNETTYYGVEAFGDESSYQFDYTQHHSTGKTVKVSIHESGQLHVMKHDRTDRTDPIHITPLSQQRGGHIATVSATCFEALPRFSKKAKAGDEHVEIEWPAGNISARAAFYINSSTDVFEHECPIRVAMIRPTVTKPIHLGIAFHSHVANTENPRVVTILGFDPMTTRQPGDQFAFVSG